MKKIFLSIIIIWVIMGLFGLAIFLRLEKDNINVGNDDITYYSGLFGKGMPYVPDAITARKMAEVILYSKYGKDINDEKPFDVSYDDKNQVWIISGNLPEGYQGGVAYVVIQKQDGKILGVWHTK